MNKTKSEKPLQNKGIMNYQEILEQAIKEYNPRHIIAMFSGGHDSLIATHIASKHPKFSFALHINTGIGIEQTREFVRKTCQEWNIELREYKASEYKKVDGTPDPQIYEDIVTKHGFPGGAQHRIMYIRLKERALKQAIRELNRKRTDKTMLITGARKEESIRRMGNVKPIQIQEGTKVWVAPIWDFTQKDKNDYIELHKLRRNIVVDLIHMSGECLCGAYATRGEKDEIRTWFPEIAQYLDSLEQKVRENGFPWGWEDDPPKWFKGYRQGQKFLSEELEILCIGCSRNYYKNPSKNS